MAEVVESVNGCLPCASACFVRIISPMASVSLRLIGGRKKPGEIPKPLFCE